MSKPQTDLETRLEAALEAMDAWCNPAVWQRSRKGNSYRQWDGDLITIFRRYGKFRWSICREGGVPDYSEDEFETEEAAKFELGRLLLGIYV